MIKRLTVLALVAPYFGFSLTMAAVLGAIEAGLDDDFICFMHDVDDFFGAPVERLLDWGWP